MRHRLYAHIVWTTLDRARLIDGDTARFLTRYFPLVCVQERAVLLSLGIVRNHVHLLALVHPETRLTRLVQRLKGGSAAIAGKEGHGRRKLRWAKGYNLQSVSPRLVEQAYRYVAEQAEHHPDDAIDGWEGWTAPRESASAGPPSRGSQPHGPT